MGSKQAQLKTALSVKQCAEVFRTGAQSARGVGSVLGGVAAKVMGNDLSGYFTPDNDSPFAALDDDPPDFSVGVFVPKFSGGGQGNGTAIHMYVWDRGTTRTVELFAPHGIGGGMHARKLVTKVAEAFTGADPGAQVATG
ncbi:hypothetical protein LXH13_32430 [Streptomyces spinosirectus]|jgi:hypothetical protein|uniref:hypothetical protein n=1 Tax=Streptomyces TaxID=1883 RepID=UPI000D37B96E|nr:MULTISPECIES: hypothetical protein [Streptomyces]MBY8341627.1 hypothetical protein [Streptomyces plumbidurans]PTM99832.1 hypothetical protein C7821_101108 [Streptomyces sp. VMFN-G11Ma]UIR21466.1 hypothetical protein LXH13_32430 [Streptomyces spinosirectus]